MIWGDDAHGISLHAPFLNLPVEGIRARADIRPGSRHIAITSAEGFGARWTGSFDRHVPDGEWQFALAADRLVVADADRWLNPHWRESFLDRVLPFLNSPSPVNASPEILRASGRLSLDQFELAPFVVRRLAGDVKIAGRELSFTSAGADFYGGKIGGAFKAKLGAAPAYHIALDFSHVDLNALSAATAKFSDLFAGDSSGEVTFDARGMTRADLDNSLACQGAARISAAELRNINLEESLRDAARHPGTTPFREVSTTFSCADRQIQFQNLLLIGSGNRIEGSGSVDFTPNLDFRLRQLPECSAPRAASASFAPGKAGKLDKSEKSDKSNDASFRLTGPLAAPTIARDATAAPPR
jgi:hypothetical protein